MQGFSDSKVGKPLMVPGWARPVLPSSSVTGSGSITGSRPRIDTETLKLPKLNLRSMLMMVAVRELNSNEVSDKAHRTRFLGCSRSGLQHTGPIRDEESVPSVRVALQTSTRPPRSGVPHVVVCAPADGRNPRLIVSIVSAANTVAALRKGVRGARDRLTCNGTASCPDG